MIIGLGYKARSGKDTVAKMMEEYGGYVVLPFAMPLKGAARMLFRLTEAQLYGDDKEKIDPFWGVTPRNLLQRLGTEAMRREFGEDFWIRAARREIAALEGTFNYVIPDVRFVNEAEAIQSWGGKVWRVDRPGAGASGGVEGHASETELDTWGGWDGVIANDSTLEDLANSVKFLFGFVP